MSSQDVFIHPQAIVESANIGAGTRVWAFAHVCPGAVIGANCNIGDGCFIEGGSSVGDNVTIKNGALIWEGVSIEDDVFVGPGVVFTNDQRPRSPRLDLVRQRYASKVWLSPTRVARGAAIGASASIGCGLTIGAFAMIGAGAVVTKSVPAYALVYGNPAKVHGHVCACGNTLRFVKMRAHCSHCRATYRKTKQGVVAGV